MKEIKAEGSQVKAANMSEEHDVQPQQQPIVLELELITAYSSSNNESTRQRAPLPPSQFEKDQMMKKE